MADESCCGQPSDMTVEISGVTSWTPKEIIFEGKRYVLTDLPPIPADFASWEDALSKAGYKIEWEAGWFGLRCPHYSSQDVHPTYPQALAAAVRHYMETSDER